MEKKNQVWQMEGLSTDDPRCIHTADELLSYIERIGFLPLFSNEIKGFSVEEMTAVDAWWTGDERTDPWMWRISLIKTGRVAYGKFFNKKAGFIAKDWFPVFANYRRDGYDFDSSYEEGLAKQRCKKIMDLFLHQDIISSIDMKSAAGFGKNGEKNFNGMLTELQMQTYLTVQDFKRKVSKKGQEYGMHIGYYAMPEWQWGYDFVTSCYKEKPEDSKAKIHKQTGIIEKELKNVFK